jgi:UDPglucose 6-dehydrogenase
MAELGHDVLGMDVDGSKIALLQQGQLPFYEPGLPELVQRGLASGKLQFTSSYAEAASFGDIHFICVGTPQKAGEYAADVSFVDNAVLSLLAGVRPGSLVVGKSTVPAGTAARLSALIEEADCELVWNPEFLREGFAVSDTLSPDRIVLGVRSDTAEKTIRQVYEKINETGTPVIVTDFATAELVKVAANAFLATKISFINAMAEVCEVVDADITHLADAIGRDERIGRRFLNAGLGFGGGCLPQGHPGVHGTGRRTRRRSGPVLPQGCRCGQRPSPGPDGRPGPRNVRRIPRRNAHRRLRRRIQT